MASEFPKLPGFVPTQEIENQCFKRRSAWQQDKNRQATTQASPAYPVPKTSLVPEPLKPHEVNSNFLTTTQSTYRPLCRTDVTEQWQPQYVHLDRQVLRFYGYFKESVPESNLENFRVRDLIVKLHLEDNAIEILETKQNNSGVPQGTFLSRTNVLKRDGSGNFINATDFKVGEITEIHGKSIMIFDADKYTREWYDAVGCNQPARRDPLVDNFKKYVTPKFSNKEWNGLNSSVLNGRVPSQKQFLNLDRKVLRFYVFSGIPYIMHYYLADDTMEIREINYANSGKDPFPLLLKRQRFPKKFALSQPGHTQIDAYIRDADICAGMTMEVFGRAFAVTTCDEFTRDHYKRMYNVDFPLHDGGDGDAKPPRGMIIPPYNGFGDEEDSLGNVYRLVPKPPKKDYFKWVDNQIQLKCTAKLNTKNPEDVDRRFIVTFYLNDDTVMVYEPQQRNSGIVSGKFLEKMKYKNPRNNMKFFEPADFIIGQDVIINSYDFHINGCDERTRKWYQEYFGVEMPVNSDN